MTPEEEIIKKKAEIFANTNKRNISRRLTSTDVYAPEENPVSVFMAGSPGAGKTESSKNLIQEFVKNSTKVLRIDPDELRSEFEDYNGSNSHLFNGAVSILVDNIHDTALKNKQSFVLDGTLSKIEIARKNIERSVKRGRFVQILYVYQDPIQAWDFVKKREKVEGRKIKKADFIRQYFSARDTVNNLRKEFGGKIKVDLLVKNIDGSDRHYKQNIDIIDNYVKEEYTVEKLNEVLE